jgi:hypothetical protein
MNGPDPGADLIGALRYLIGAVDDLRRDVSQLRDASGIPRTYSVLDLSRRWGISTAALYQDPVKLPNFGRSDVGNGKKRWFHETVEAWEKRPEIERREQWERLTVKERYEFHRVAS